VRSAGREMKWNATATCRGLSGRSFQSLGDRLSGTDLHRKTRAEDHLLNPSTNPTTERIQFIKLRAATSR
jgi:hypothetical protein